LSGHHGFCRSFDLVRGAGFANGGGMLYTSFAVSEPAETASATEPVAPEKSPAAPTDAASGAPSEEAPPRPALALALLALASSSLVTTEVLVTRLLSAVTWYGQAFFVLSLAMVGLAAGSLDADRARESGVPWSAFCASRLARAAVGILVATTVACFLPVQAGTASASLLRLLLLSAVCTWPLASGGAVVARLMADAKTNTATLYAVDLGAAAVGALAPLLMLGPLSAPGALVFVSLVLLLGSAAAAPAQRRGGIAGAVLCALLLWMGSSGSIDLEPRFLKGLPRPATARLRYNGWNALSHVMLTEFSEQPIALWSPSPLTPNVQIRAATALIDGEAGTPMYANDRPELLRALKLDAVFTAHELRPDGAACVIGVGGGRDIAAALIAGHDPVYGVEINPAIRAMHDSAAAESNLVNDPRVVIQIGDGRVVYARSNVQCRVLQASLVDTWAATAAGAFAHAEATLYTREAWSVFLRRVEPDGVLTFSRWYNPRSIDETARLLALAMSSLMDRGARSPRDHIALVGSGRVATILVSPSPFSAADLATLRSVTERYRYTLVAVPGEAARSPLLESILSARTLAEIDRAGDARGLDTSAPTDDRPFFFQLASARMWLTPWRLFSVDAGSGGVIAGNITAARELVTTFAAVLLVGAFLLGRPLARAFRGDTLPGAASAGYFAALGFGFMVAEIALVQRMHVVLGHPTWALIVVLAGLLVAMGAGSALSPRWIKTARAVSVLCVAVAVMLVVAAFVVIPVVARSAMFATLWTRAAMAATVSILLGIPLGMCFPAGLRFVERGRGAPAALAINGVTGVLGSVVALVVSVAKGIPTSFALAAAVYLVAALLGPSRWKPVAPQA
jgi:spermidine synthase